MNAAKEFTHGSCAGRFRIELAVGNGGMAWDAETRRFRKLDSGQYTKYKTQGTAGRAARKIIRGGYSVRVVPDTHFWNAPRASEPLSEEWLADYRERFGRAFSGNSGVPQ